MIRSWPSSSGPSPYRGRETPIPKGTVASRIANLQKLAGASSTNKPSLPSPRVLASPKVDIGRYVEEHAPPDKKSQLERTSGTHEQPTPVKFENRLQDKADASESIQSISKVEEDYVHRESDLLEVSNSTKSETQILASTDASSLGDNGVDNIIPTERQPETQIEDGNKLARSPPTLSSKPVEEHSSSETTSETRRQSVKDLFKQYGIQRPVELLSPESVIDNLDETPLITHINCHVCAWTNGPNTACGRCGHVLCRKCDFLFSGGTKEDGYISYAESIPKPKLPNLLQDVSWHEPPGIPEKDSRMQSSKQKLHNQKIELGQGTKQSNSAPSVYTRGNISPRPLPQQITPPRAPGSIQNFRSTLAEASGSSSTLPSSPMQAGNSHGRARHEQANAYCAISHTRSSSEIKHDECASLDCLATHTGHKPYRHSISCLRKRHACFSGTDSKQLVKVSHSSEEDPEKHVHCDCGTNRGHRVRNGDIALPEKGKINLPQSQKSPHRLYRQSHHCKNGHRNSEQPVSPGESNEYPSEVNNRGYTFRYKCSKRTIRVCSGDKSHKMVSAKGITQPLGYCNCRKTGHTPSPGPIISDAVRDCQHFFTDCECETCQRVKHNFRYCEQKDHHDLLIHHRYPHQREFLSSVPELSSQVYVDSTAEAPDHVAAPKPQRRLTSPPWMNLTQKSEQEREINVKRLSTSKISNANTPLPTKIHSSRAANQNFKEHDFKPTQVTSLTSGPISPAQLLPTFSSGHSGETTADTPYRRSFTPPSPKHEPSYDVGGPLDFKVQEQNAIPSVSSKEKVQEGSESYGSVLNATMEDMMDEALHREDANSKQSSTVQIPSRRSPPPACGQCRSRRRMDRDVEDANYFIERRNTSAATEVKAGGMTSPLLPRSSDRGTSFGSVQQEKRRGMANESEDVASEQRPDLRRTSGEPGAPGNIGIQGITVVIHLDGKEDLVVRTKLKEG